MDRSLFLDNPPTTSRRHDDSSLPRLERNDSLILEIASGNCSRHSKPFRFEGIDAEPLGTGVPGRYNDGMDRLSVLCFAGTYALALLSDLARVVVRLPIGWYTTVCLTALGWFVQTAYLGNLAFRQQKLPVTTVFESLLVLSWILAGITLYFLLRSPRPVAVGVFLLPVVLAVNIVAGISAPRADWADWGGWVGFWGAVHGVFLLAGGVGSCVAFASGLMYLVQSRRLKQKQRARIGFTLPSLEQLDRWNRGAITAAFPLLTCGLILGVAVELSLRRSAEAMLNWTDPKILSALLMWIVFAVLVHARFQPTMRGRRVMILTVIAFAFLAFAWVGVDLLLPTAHGVPRSSTVSTPTP